MKRIREESLSIQEVYVQSPYLGLKDDNWKELLGDILCTVFEMALYFLQLVLFASWCTLFLCRLKRRHIGITFVGGGGVSYGGVRISLSGA